MLDFEDGKRARFEIVVENLLTQCGACPAHLLAFCSEAEAEALASLDRAVRQVSLRKGQVVVEEGAVNAGLCTVVSGGLRLYKTLRDGRRLITAFRFPGEAVIGAVNGQPAPAAVQALAPTVLCQLDYGELTPLRAAYPELNERLEALAADKSAEDEAHMLTLGRKSPPEKLATFLLEMERRMRMPFITAGCDAEDCPSEATVRLPMTRQDIADYLGLETETTSRLFSRFKDDGIIALPRPSLVVLRDRKALVALAAGCAPATP